jgi:hypothetical protein
MITTIQLASELKISQRAIQNRILRLGLRLQRAGNAFVLSESQASKVRSYMLDKVALNKKAVHRNV